MTFERDLKNNYDMENIHKNAVNNIDKLSLLHGILNPSKHTKITILTVLLSSIVV